MAKTQFTDHPKSTAPKIFHKDHPAPSQRIDPSKLSIKDYDGQSRPKDYPNQPSDPREK